MGAQPEINTGIVCVRQVRNQACLNSKAAKAAFELVWEYPVETRTLITFPKMGELVIGAKPGYTEC